MSKIEAPYKVVKVRYTSDKAGLDDLAGNCNELHREGYNVVSTQTLTEEGEDGKPQTWTLIYAKKAD